MYKNKILAIELNLIVKETLGVVKNSSMFSLNSIQHREEITGRSGDMRAQKFEQLVCGKWSYLQNG